MRRLLLFWLLFQCCCTAVSAQDLLAVPPSLTDARIKNFNDPHYCYQPAFANRGYLVLFFPGNGSIPQDADLFLKKAAIMGYHSAGISYPASPTVSGLCSGQDDSLCFSDARAEILTGSNRHNVIDVDRYSCIDYRVLKLLQYLKQQSQGKGWQQYLTGDTAIRWERIILAGHGEGAAQAAYMAKTYAVRRVVLFSAADYWSQKNRPAAWMNTPGETEADRYFAFTHTGDELISYSRQQECWKALGMTTDLVSVDSTVFPYRGSHSLTTGRQPALTTGNPNHQAVVKSAWVPKNLSGDAVYDGVWEYLLGDFNVAVKRPTAATDFRVTAQGTVLVSADTEVSVLDLSGRLLMCRFVHESWNTELGAGIYIFHTAAGGGQLVQISQP